MQLQQLTCLLTLVLKGGNGELPGSVQPKGLFAQNNSKDVIAKFGAANALRFVHCTSVTFPVL